MAFLFSRSGGRWRALHITAVSGHFSCAPLRFSAAAVPQAAGALPFLFRALNDGANARWVLFANGAPGLSHNGAPLRGGLRALGHRDALSMGKDASAFFSTEEMAAIAPFAGAKPVKCPRCRTHVDPGAPSVRCPNCGVVHHQTPERGCWSYARTCASCDRATAFDHELAWTPEAL